VSAERLAGEFLPQFYSFVKPPSFILGGFFMPETGVIMLKKCFCLEQYALKSQM